MFDKLKEDYFQCAGKKGNILLFILRAVEDGGFRAVVLYRIGHWCRKHHLKLLAVLCEKLMRHLCLCWVSTQSEIGGGLKIAHGIGLVIGSKTVIGKNCFVRQNTTFGGDHHKVGLNGRTQPWLGDNISVGVGAVIIGPVKIGSNCVIGANAVVTKDFPENVIVGGVPAKVIKQRWDESSGRKP